MIYLASPYWDPSADVRKQRHDAAKKVAMKLIMEGIDVFSPVVYSVALQGPQDTDCLEQWLPFDLSMIEASSELWVLELPGWRESKGVKKEIVEAHLHSKKVLFLTPEEHGI